MSIRLLSAAEWDLLREVRLAALRESPWWFLSTYAKEWHYGQQHWRDEFRRGIWLICTSDEGAPEALLGATRGTDIPCPDRYLSYLWVAPAVRGRGVGTKLVTEMLSHLRERGVPRVWLWVFDGNDAAHRLYRKLGFKSTGLRNQVGQRPVRIEERFLLELS